jgi:7-carboxy-7-deazaguanine synthase
MSKQLIEAGTFNNPDEYGKAPYNQTLDVSEFFTDTIQGEGIYTGINATFLRLQGCTLNCIWCDTTEVWQVGSPWTFDQLFKLMEEANVINKLRDTMAHHLIITGGSPLLQQMRIVSFIKEFIDKYGFLPFIEVENEVALPIHPDLDRYVSCWNNSPKLSTSGNSRVSRYKEKIIKDTANLMNSWFKFVITSSKDWDEIFEDFIAQGLVKYRQIILMPEGVTREQILKNGPKVAELAIKHNVNYSSREHVILWDRKTGV